VHEAFTVYLGSDGDSHWIVVDSPEARDRLRRLRPASPERVLLADELSASLEPPGIDCLRVESVEGLEALSAAIPRCEGLKYLQVPIAAAGLVSGVPATTETLTFSGAGQGSLTSGVVLPSVRRLVAAEGKLGLARSNLPSLRSLAVKLWTRASIDRVTPFEDLEALTLTPCPAWLELASLPGRSLRFLRLSGGKVSSLSGVGALSRLTNAWFHDLPQLADISALVELQGLEELSFVYCRRLVGLEVIFELPRLRKVLFSGCGNIGVSGLLGRREAQALDEFHVAGTT